MKIKTKMGMNNKQIPSIQKLNTQFIFILNAVISNYSVIIPKSTIIVIKKGMIERIY